MKKLTDNLFCSETKCKFKNISNISEMCAICSSCRHIYPTLKQFEKEYGMNPLEGTPCYKRQGEYYIWEEVCAYHEGWYDYCEWIVFPIAPFATIPSPDFIPK